MRPCGPSWRSSSPATAPTIRRSSNVSRRCCSSWTRDASSCISTTTPRRAIFWRLKFDCMLDSSRPTRFRPPTRRATACETPQSVLSCQGASTGVGQAVPDAGSPKHCLIDRGDGGLGKDRVGGPSSSGTAVLATCTEGETCGRRGAAVGRPLHNNRPRHNSNRRKTCLFPPAPKSVKFLGDPRPPSPLRGLQVNR